MIDYKIIKYNEIDKSFLKGFIRYQITEEVMYVSNNELLKKKDRFLESWDDSKLSELSMYLKEEVKKQGVLLAAYDNLNVIGFALINFGLFNDGYINLDYLHVSKDYRHKGIGRKLFNLISKEASKLGAKKLYISGHPNIYTQMFYENIGCVLAKQINEELFKQEPLDIHLEKEL